MKVRADSISHDLGFVCVANFTNQLLWGILVIIFCEARLYQDIQGFTQYGAQNNLVWSPHRLKMTQNVSLEDAQNDF